MRRKKIHADNQTKPVRRKQRRQKGVSLSYRYRLLMIACAMCLIVGFFFAARQHFSSIDYSIKNSRLRKMSEELESDKRRLLLAKEIALSPSEIKKAAQKIGYKAINAANVDFLRPAAKPEKPRAEKSETAKPKQPVAAKTVEPTAAEKAPAKKVREEKPPEAKIKRENAQSAK